MPWCLTWNIFANVWPQPQGGLIRGGQQSEHILAGLVYIHKCRRIVLSDKHCQIMTEIWQPGAALLRMRQESECRIDLALRINLIFQAGAVLATQ